MLGVRTDVLAPEGKRCDERQTRTVLEPVVPLADHARGAVLVAVMQCAADLRRTLAFRITGSIASIAEITLREPAARTIMPAAIPSPRPIDHGLAPTIPVARIIWPLHHDDGAWAIDDRPLNDHDTAHDRPMDDIVVITIPAVPIARIGRSCTGQRPERQRAGQGEEKAFGFASRVHGWDPATQ
jgi:hypothetical protein